MELIVEILNITTGGNRIAILSEQSASLLGVHSSDRIKLNYGDHEAIAITNIAANFPMNRIGLYEEIALALGVKEDEKISVQLAPVPESLINVRAKLRGERLREQDIITIVKDVVERHLSSVEIAAFLTALKIYGLSTGEVEALSRAMVATGKSISFGEGPILDKHSVGGIPGDKTSMLVVPIVAAAGFTIPKTSSRAITSPAGTADRVETLCPVDLSMGEIKDVVAKTNGCLVWGGSLELAPADDLFIQVEYPLGIDPLLLPSILSKKKAIGATHVVIDIPTGVGAKIKTRTEAYTLASDFVDLGKRLGLNIQCALTLGDQPLGCSIGPALEAKEALTTLMGGGPQTFAKKQSASPACFLKWSASKMDKLKQRKYLIQAKRRKCAKSLRLKAGTQRLIQLICLLAKNTMWYVQIRLEGFFGLALRISYVLQGRQGRQRRRAQELFCMQSLVEPCAKTAFCLRFMLKEAVSWLRRWSLQSSCRLLC